LQGVRIRSPCAEHQACRQPIGLVLAVDGNLAAWVGEFPRKQIGRSGEI
jgi:hypothetical protein